MKKIGIAEIEDGLILAKEVVNENDQLLLGAGVTIKKDQIEKLLENNILEVYVLPSNKFILEHSELCPERTNHN